MAVHLWLHIDQASEEQIPHFSFYFDWFHDKALSLLESSSGSFSYLFEVCMDHFLILRLTKMVYHLLLSRFEYRLLLIHFIVVFYCHGLVNQASFHPRIVELSSHNL